MLRRTHDGRTVRRDHRARQVANLVNLSTPAGLLVAKLGGAETVRAHHGLYVARGYRLAVPPAPAFTLGNVVLLRKPAPPGADPVASIPPALMRHEEAHATQYAFCGGLIMPVLYVGAAAWSWWRTGDFGAANVFERRAGLAEGGYLARPVRPAREARTELRSMVGRRVRTAPERLRARRPARVPG